MSCRRSAAGDTVLPPAMACPPRPKAKWSFPADSARIEAALEFEQWGEALVEKDNKNPKLTPIDSAAVRNSELEDMYRRLEPAMRRPRHSPAAVAAAVESAQRLAAEADAEDAAGDMNHDLAAEISIPCAVCGYENRPGTKFCGMCGVPVASEQTTALAERPPSAASPQSTSAANRETHHYHHHYHHHYFPGATAPEAPYSRPALEPVREEKYGPNAA